MAGVSPAGAGLPLSSLSLPLVNAICWIARISRDVILGVARFGGSVTLCAPPPGAIAYLLWLMAMVFASRLFLRSGKTRALAAFLIADVSALLWLLG